MYLFKEKEVEHNVLENILNSPKPIENLIVYWLDRSSNILSFGPENIQELDENVSPDEDIISPQGNSILFVSNDKPVSVLAFDVMRLKKFYKKVDSYFEPITLADSGEKRLQFEEVQKHREKNGAKWDEEAEKYIINPSFVGNLCLSYLIDNRAMIKINRKLLEDNKYRIRDYYIIEIMQMDKLAGYETYAVMEDRLIKYVAK